MLPEHVALLREWSDEDTKEERKQLDEQKLDTLNETAGKALEYGKEVIITHFNNSRYEEYIGTISHFDALQGEFSMVNQSGVKQRILVEDIEQIKLVD